MSKISDLPALERPREKAFRYGIEKLSDIELLAILIGCGTVEKSALDIAYELLKNSKGLYNLFQTRYQDFLKIKGVKNSKAIKLAATFELGKRYEISKTNLSQKIENSNEAYQHIFPLISNQNNEIFILLILNKKKEIIFI